MIYRLSLLLIVCCPQWCAAQPAEIPDPAPDFSKQIRPILAAACFQCHGPDDATRQAELRLDQRASAVKMRADHAAIVPGQPQQSELIQRITAKDESVMPPPEATRRLNPDEIALLTQWIESGADYEQHWAFVPPVMPAVPSDPSGWGSNPIDAFIAAKHRAEQMEPDPPADRRTLIRRVTLDLIGLPPSPGEIEHFLNDTQPGAYGRLVTRLLADPRYGERMASHWLDLARYADSGGYQGDIPRTMWPWRDWVIQAFNDNMPYDQFSIEQLAGDLLPNASADQIIATGFNRNHRINDEDGIIPEEFRVEYVVDRAETTATVWLGLTMGCARCHDHKFDPISQKEFYAFYAFFNNIDETGRGYGNTQPLYYFDPETRPKIEEIDRKLVELGDAAQGEYAKVLELKKERDAILAESLTTMVMQERKEPRDTFVLDRGLYNAPKEKVSAGVPAALPSLEELPRNRLGLAQWLFSGKHPLTARVAVNRMWQMHFGTGLVDTPANFGTTGSPPSHPQLLDWLASEFVRTGWDMKQMHRLIVTSATYRQSSQGTPEECQRDPQNRLLARGPRVRLSAEAIRDQALAAAGLLTHRIGGPSVKPYQPQGIWEEAVSFAKEYKQSHGADLYRRTLYSYLRRTVPPPSLNAFDFAMRDACTVQRAETNTPLQSLVLMNDTTFVEAARVLAQRSLNWQDDWLSLSFERILARHPTKRERQLLTDQYEYHLAQFAEKPGAAERLSRVGEYPHPENPEANIIAIAARTAVISLILNLDETLNRE